MADVEWRLKTLESKVSVLESDGKAMHTKQAEHQLRLENGGKAFQAAAVDRDALGQRIGRLEPKDPNYFRFAAFLLTVFLAATGALWVLAGQFRERPTFNEVEHRIDRHGHEDISNMVNDIRVDIGQQSAELKSITAEQNKMSKAIEEMSKAGRRRRR